jgi:hypothetical protein
VCRDRTGDPRPDVELVDEIANVELDDEVANVELDDDPDWWEPCTHECDEECDWDEGCRHEHCWNCGGCGCPGYCDDYQTYNLRPAETGG